MHSTRRGTKKAIDDAIYNAGASNLYSEHRDFDRYGIAYEVVVIDQALSDEQVQGLIDDIPTVKELIDRIVADAEAIIKDRMTGMLV